MQAAINDHRNHLRFTFAARAATDIDTFSVIDLQGCEAIGRPFSFTLTLAVTRDRKIDPNQMLSTSATLTICMPAGAAENVDNANNTSKPIPYHGVLAEFDELEKIGDLAFYRAILTPRFARASLNRISDVYLKQQSIAATLADVLADNVFPDRKNGFQFALKNQYEARDSICQYQESTFDFISRWMEKEGMYYYFEHGDEAQGDGNDVDKMIIVDDTIKLPDSLMRLHYRPAGRHSSDPVDQAVQTFICRRTPLPKQVILQDFNYRAAAAPLRVLHEIAGGGIYNGDVMLYGEDFRTQEQGHRYARLRAEEIACGGVRYCGSSTAVGLRSGHFMDLIDSPLSPDASGKFLITEIEHRGSQAGLLLSGIKHSFEQDGGEIFYRNNFTAIPGSMQFRAARTTPRPTIAGTMSAVIDADGKSKYANLDEQGQYHVQMPFIRQDQDPPGPKPANQGSARIRMATPYAGNNHGMDFPLHQGAEVLLSFINGDPDQPVIMNAVPNSANPSTVNNAAPQLSRIVSAGGNKITINDTAGNESIELKALNGNGTALIGSKAGNAFFSKGNTNLITLGAYNKLLVGPNNTVSASTDTSFSISLAAKIAMGASLSYTLGSDIKWNSSWSETTTLDEGTSYSLKEEDKKQAGKEISLSAGYNAEEAAALAALDSLKIRIKLGIAAVTAINLATGVAAAVLTGEFGEVKGGKNVLNTASPHNIAAVASDAGVTAITTAAGVGVLHALIRNLVKKYAALTCASKMLLNKSGISQTYNPTAEITRVSQLKFDGITHAAYSKDEAGDVVCAHRLSLGEKGSQLLAGSTIGGAEASLILEAAGTGVLMASGKLDIAAQELVIQDKKGAAIAAQDGTVNIAAGKIVIGFTSPAPLEFSKMQSDAATETSLVRTREIGRKSTPAPDPFHGFSVADAAVQMQFKDSGVKATADSLTLAFGGSGVTFSASGATMRGDMIKIG
ncbi:MAG: Rhs element Vgr protein [Herbaspirillum sp.]|nr:Rhs element Vgr protein [Herbaspirillum sp.]